MLTKWGVTQTLPLHEIINDDRHPAFVTPGNRSSSDFIRALLGSYPMAGYVRDVMRYAGYMREEIRKHVGTMNDHVPRKWSVIMDRGTTTDRLYGVTLRLAVYVEMTGSK